MQDNQSVVIPFKIRRASRVEYDARVYDKKVRKELSKVKKTNKILQERVECM